MGPLDNAVVGFGVMNIDGRFYWVVFRLDLFATPTFETNNHSLKSIAMKLLCEHISNIK